MARTSLKTEIAVCGALALLLVRAVPAFRFEILPRTTPKHLSELVDSTRLSADDRDRLTFGAYVEAFRLLDREMPADGILSLAGFDPGNPAQAAAVRALRTNLHGRLVRTTAELEDYLLVRRRDLFDRRVFVLRFVPSDAIDAAWRPYLDTLLERPKFVIQRIKGPVR